MGINKERKCSFFIFWTILIIYQIGFINFSIAEHNKEIAKRAEIYASLKNQETCQRLEIEEQLRQEQSIIKHEQERLIQAEKEKREAKLVAFSGVSRGGGTRDSIKDRIVKLIEQRNMQFNSNMDAWTVNDIADTIIVESNANNVNPLLIASQIDVESKYRPSAESKFGAKGIMQILPSTAKSIASDLNMTSYNLSNYKDSIKMGTYYYVHNCVEAWSHDNIQQYNPKTGNLMSAYEMGLLTYNGGTRTARTLKNIQYLYSIEEVMQSI